MSVVTFGVIAGARARQRRRHVAILAAAICLGVGVGLAAVRSGSPHASAPMVAATANVAPAAVLSRTPVMGVACPRRSCDWVGLAVWLRTPAVAVSATIAGQPIQLEATNAYSRAGAAATFVGFLHRYQRVTSTRLDVGDRPTTWDVASDVRWPQEEVQLRIRSTSGSLVLTRLRVTLQPGWG
jgi:hypothetical protein